MPEDKDFKQIQEDVSSLNEKHLYRHNIVLNYDDSIYLKVSFISNTNEELTTARQIIFLIREGKASFCFRDSDVDYFDISYNSLDREIYFNGTSQEIYDEALGEIDSYDIDTLI